MYVLIQIINLYIFSRVCRFPHNV